MPYDEPSERERFRREHEAKPKGFVRYRTIREGAHRVVIGVTRTGKTAVVSVLHPKGEVRTGRPARGMRRHAKPHGRGHHGGPCDGACRRGYKMHAHRR